MLLLTRERGVAGEVVAVVDVDLVSRASLSPGVELLDAGAVCPLIVVFLFERYFSTCIFGSAEFCLHGLSHGPRPRFVKEGRESECSRELLLVACNGGPCAFDTMLQFRLQRLFESDNIYQLAVPS